MKLGEFFVSVVVDSAKGDLSVRGLVSRFGELETGALASLGAVSGVADALASMTNGAIGTALAIGDFSAKTGLSTKELQKWQAAGMGVGLSAEQVAGGIESISGEFAKMKTMQPSAITSLLGKLAAGGANFNTAKGLKGPFEFLMELRKVAGSMHPDLFQNAISGAGLGNFTALLKMPAKEFDELRRKAAIMFGQQQEDLKHEHELLVTMSEQWKKLDGT